MLIAGAMQAVVDALGSLTFFIDRGVYTLAKVVYDVFMFISDARLLDNSIALNLTRRIYAILSIFMLFVLGYNLLLYIIDPDKMIDKENGMGAIIKDVIIALVIIILLPTLFNRLYTLQSMVLKSGVIENILLGGYTEVEEDELGNTSEASPTDRIEKGVNIMIANTYAAFLLPDDKNNFTVLQCGETNEGADGKTYSDYCDAWKSVKETGNISYFATFVGNDDYKYYPVVSTVVGVILIFFMLSFCINIAIRAAKMAVLQLIAPIPLVLEILPNKRGVRKGWIDELVKVYLQVFIYMSLIFLVIFLVSLVPNVVKGIIAATFGADVQKESGTFTMLVASLIICYGLLQFGKEAPGYVLKLLGIESTGILKAAGIRAATIATGTAGLATSTVGRFSRNFAETYKLNRGEKQNVLKSLGSATLSGTAGATSGIGRTLWNARNVHTVAEARKNTKAVTEAVTKKRMERDAFAANSEYGRSLKGVMTQHIDNAAKSVQRKFTGATGISGDMFVPGDDVSYATKRKIEKANTEVESAWKNGFGALMNSATAQHYEELEKQARDTGGEVKDSYTGDMINEATAKAKKINAQKIALENANPIKLMEAAQALNTANANNRGVVGIHDKYIDPKEVVKTRADGKMVANLDYILDSDPGGPGGANSLERIIKTNGFKQQLDELKKDNPYQARKIRERGIEETNAKTKQAVNEKNKETNGKK